jgi:Uncharacterized protein conserved in cyanobacteria
MIAPVMQNITLDEFLALGNVDDSPAWEYVNGTVMPKPMPKLRHAIIQKRLLSEIDAHTEVFTALPELRCTFGNRSFVPDIAVIAWERLGISSRGEFDDDFNQAPDWSMEILSPEQNVSRVIDNLLHCLRYGCQLAWLIDPDDSSVIVFMPNQLPLVCHAENELPVISGIELSLTPARIMAWLRK